MKPKLFNRVDFFWPTGSVEPLHQVSHPSAAATEPGQADHSGLPSCPLPLRVQLWGGCEESQTPTDPGC